MNKEKHKILHLIETTGPGGAETVLVNIVKNLDPDMFDSVVVLTGEGWLYDTLVDNGIKTVIVPSESANDLKFLRAILRIIGKNKMGLIHSHLGGMNFYACLAGLLSARPVLVTYHGVVGDWDVKNFKNRVKHALISYYARNIITVSDFLKRELVRVWGFEERKIRRIYNGVDFNRFRPQDIDITLRGQFNIPERAPLVGMVGNIRQTKGYDIYVRAAGITLERIPDCRFLIVGQGKGSLLDDLRNLVEELKISDKVIFTGFRDDIPSVLSQLDLFVLASTSEGLSIATIEAMGMRKPVVVTKSGGPEEIVEDGISGFLVPINDPQALADKIVGILADDGTARKIADNAARMVREKFNIEKNIEEYVRIYKSCLGI